MKRRAAQSEGRASAPDVDAAEPPAARAGVGQRASLAAWPFFGFFAGRPPGIERLCTKVDLRANDSSVWSVSSERHRQAQKNSRGAVRKVEWWCTATTQTDGAEERAGGDRRSKLDKGDGFVRPRGRCVNLGGVDSDGRARNTWGNLVTTHAHLSPPSA